MIKKVGLFILSFIAILGIGTSFADLISLPKHSEIPEEKCVMFESVEVGNGRVISFNKNLGKVEEEHAKYCLSDEITNDNNFVYNITSGWKSNIEFYVLDYNIDIDDVSIDNIEDKADKILINRSERPRRTIVGPYPVRHEYIYKIIVNGSGLFETKRIGENRINLEEENNINPIKQKNRITPKPKKDIRIIFEEENNINPIKQKNISDIMKFGDFIYARVITILVETLLLFFIAKFCRKSRSIKTRKLIITGVLASTVTLPLLWFLLPIFFNNYWIYVIFGEILVTVIETFIIKYSLKVERKMAIIASIICNLCSFLVGLFIF